MRRGVVRGGGTEGSKCRLQRGRSQNAAQRSDSVAAAFGSISAAFRQRFGSAASACQNAAETLQKKTTKKSSVEGSVLGSVFCRAAF